MPITFACPCGKQLKVGDQFAGERARCPACAAVLEVPDAVAFPAPPPAPAIHEDTAYTMTDDGPLPPPPAARHDDPDDYRRPSSLAPPTVRRRDPDDPPRARYREVSEADEPEADGRPAAGRPHLPTVFGGLFSVALGGLLCWLRNGGVSIVGVVLIVLGLISVVKGLLGYPDE